MDITAEFASSIINAVEANIHAEEKWTTLAIPRGGSEQFNTANWGQTGKSHS
jgi:hypothetical protein